MPVAKSQSVFGRPTTEIDDEGEDDKADDREYFDGGENEFCLTVDGHGKDIKGDDDYDDDRDPGCNINAVCAVPELYHDGGGGDLGAEGDGAGVPIL